MVAGPIGLVIAVPWVALVVVVLTALGAIFLAGLGCGLWEDQTALTNAWIKDRSFEPADDVGAIEALQTRWRAAVDKS